MTSLPTPASRVARPYHMVFAFLFALTAACDPSPLPLEPVAATTPPTSLAVAAAPSLTVANLTVLSGKTYQRETSFTAGDTQYIDRAYTLPGPIPDTLTGTIYIRTANDDKSLAPGADAVVGFDVDRDAVVYVGHDNRLARPAWLTDGFEDTGIDLKSSDTATVLSLFRRTVPAGRVALGSNLASTSERPGPSMYGIWIRPARTATVLAITNLTSQSGTTYDIGADLSTGAAHYIDRPYTVLGPLPREVEGATYIRTANDDKEALPGRADFLSFDLNAGATIYVGHDSRLPTPGWLTSGFTASGLTLLSSDNSTTFKLFQRRFSAGRVTLGSNLDAPTSLTGLSMYVVMIQPAVDTAPTASPTPTEAPSAHAGFYVAPSGTSAGDGSRDHPWSLRTALAHPSAVQPGDTLWLRGGTYAGCFTSQLTGTASAPIVVRQYPGERAVLDNGGCNDPALTAWGAYTWFWGFEVQSSNPHAGGPLGVNGFGTELKFINLVIHDASATGLGFWSQATGGEVYGTILYNNGRTPNLDHAIYTQNSRGTKWLTDNVAFNQFAYGFHVYGSDAAPLTGYTIEGNALFNNGSTNGTAAPNLLVGGGQSASRIVVANNMTYHSRHSSGNVWLGYSDAQNQDLVLRDNYIAGGFTALRLWRWSSGTVSGNTVYSPSYVANTLGSLGGLAWSGNTWHHTTLLAAWQYNNQAYPWSLWRTVTGLGANDRELLSAPTGPTVFVRPNRYEAGRGHVVVYNWSRQSGVSVDIGGIVNVGDRYEVRSVLDLQGPPLLSGTYGGGPLTLPMQTRAAPPPLGGGAQTGAGAGLEFDVFLITKPS